MIPAFKRQTVSFLRVMRTNKPSRCMGEASHTEIMVGGDSGDGL